MAQGIQAEYLSIRDAATYLAFSRRTIERRVKDGTIASVKVGKSIRIPLSEIERVMNQDAMPKEPQ